MIASTLSKYSRPRIPKVTCSKCGAHMRLLTVESCETGDGKLTFDCQCGHQYQLTEKAINSLAHDRSDIW